MATKDVAFLAHTSRDGIIALLLFAVEGVFAAERFESLPAVLLGGLRGIFCRCQSACGAIVRDVWAPDLDLLGLLRLALWPAA